MCKWIAEQEWKPGVQVGGKVRTVETGPRWWVAGETERRVDRGITKEPQVIVGMSSRVHGQVQHVLKLV